MASAFKDQEISTRKPTGRDLLNFMLENEEKILGKILPLSTGGTKNITDAFARLKNLAERRRSQMKLVDKNLSLSMRLLKGISETKNLKPFVREAAEKNLGEFETGTLELFKRLRRLKDTTTLESINLTTDLNIEATKKANKILERLKDVTDVKALMRGIDESSIIKQRKDILRAAKSEFKKKR